MAKVIHKNLWIQQFIHALTVVNNIRIYALTVVHLRINGRFPIYTGSVPIKKAL
jgi:hypothetical protein